MAGQQYNSPMSGVRRLNQKPIIIAVVFIVFLVAIWHGRNALPENALHYITGSNKNRPSFYEIAMKYGTDKVGPKGHNYQWMYETRLSPLRDEKFKMLEIGLGCNMAYGPGASYHLWLEYFPHVDLYYIEYDAKCAAQWANKTTGATIFTGDQADKEFLEQFKIATGGGFDVIIDDGGHTMIQQKTSLQVLWDAVKPGGIYFIEDLDTSYHASFGGGAGVPMEGTFMDDMKHLLDDLNRHKGSAPKLPFSKDIVKFDMTQEVIALTKVNPRFGESGKIGESWLNP